MLIVVFGSLTVEGDAERLTVYFGFGLIRKRLPMQQIGNAGVVRNQWYYGLGIRLTPWGWMFKYRDWTPSSWS